MRFIHLSDTHLGYSEFGRVDPANGINVREQDAYNAFDAAINHILGLAPDFVVHAGDLFHSPRPSNRAIVRAAEGLKRLADAHIPVIVIAGNHEVPRVTASGSIFEFLPLLGIQAVYRPEYQVIRVHETALHCLPHLPIANDLSSKLATLRPDPGARFNILVMHCAVRDTGEIYSASEFNELTLGREQLTGLDGFDYIALGHYHKHIKVASNAFYSGSLERFSFREAGYAKGFLEVNLDSHKQQFHEVKCRSMISIKPITCRGKAAGAIMLETKGALDQAQPLADAIVRVELANIDPAVWFEIDHRQIREWAAAAFDLRIEKTLDEKVRAGQTGVTKMGGLVAEFAAFITTAKLEGLERSRVRQLGEEYLARVEEEVGE